MEHLSLEIFDLEGTGSKYATLPGNASINITDTSEIFASGDVWTHEFKLSVDDNEHIFGSAADMHGSRLHDQLHRRRARLWVEGLPLFLGYLMLGDEAEVGADGSVSVTFESGQKTFDDLIEGAKASQVPMMGDVMIGMALWRKRWTRFRARLTASAAYGVLIPVSGDVVRKGAVGDDKDVFTFEADGEKDNNAVQEYPRMVFPKGRFVSWNDNATVETVDCVNTDDIYTEDADGTPTNPYCNTALCYQKYGYEKISKYGAKEEPDYSAEPEAQRGYEYMPASRVNSAPNFFVIYWIRALMKHLGIHVEENQMMGMEDLRRLFFVNTRCAYEEPARLRTLSGSELDDPEVQRYGRFWCGSSVYDRPLVPEHLHPERAVNVEESGFVAKDVQRRDEYPALLGDITLTIRKVEEWTDGEKKEYIKNNNYFHRAYATGDCFPDVEISEVIKAIEDGFGVRFLFSDNYRRVRIVLLRNVLRSTGVQTIDCDVTGESKVDNCIRGFRMTYGDVDDTQFHYKGFDDKLPRKQELWTDTADRHDYSHWKTDAVYADLINRVSAFDKTCYVTPETGNAYIIKIDKDAKRYDDLHPSVFEGAGYMDAMDGDCTGGDNTVKTVTLGFRPAIMNDLNMDEERGKDGKAPVAKQRFALFVEEEMRPRRLDLGDLAAPASYNDPDADYKVDGVLYKEDGEVTDEYVGYTGGTGVVKPGEFAIRSDMFASGSNATVDLEWLGFHVIADFGFDGHINEGYRLYLQDNYEPNDEGVSPIEKHDWGLTLCIMRGSGDDAGIKEEFDPDDHEGNNTWEVVPGSNVTAHPDTCDCYGNLWDYNGVQAGVGDTEGRFSLKLRAEKPNPYFDPTQPESAANRRYLEITNQALRGRGLCDKFYKEYSKFIREARVARRTVPMTLAQLLAIDKTVKVRVGDITGFVRKMEYSVSNDTGLGMVTMEILYI